MQIDLQQDNNDNGNNKEKTGQWEQRGWQRIPGKMKVGSDKDNGRNKDQVTKSSARTYRFVVKKKTSNLWGDPNRNLQQQYQQ